MHKTVDAGLQGTIKFAQIPLVNQRIVMLKQITGSTIGFLCTHALRLKITLENVRLST